MKSLRLILLSLLLLLLPEQAHGAIAAKRINPIMELPTDIRALASNQEVIALVGEGIYLLPRSASSFDEALSVESKANLFTDVITSGESFIAIGVAESSVVTSKVMPEKVINPDSIPVTSGTEKSVGLTRLVLTEFLATGQVVKESFFEFERPLVPATLLATSSTIAVVGTIASEKGYQGFLSLINRQSGEFSLHLYGSSSTTINALANTKTLYGSSSERLLSSDRRGISDGVIFYLDNSSKLTRVVRSFQASSEREWISVGSSHLAVGPVVRGNASEVAITKFTTKGEPSWFFRLPGSDPRLFGTMVGFITNKRVDGIANFSPKGATALFLTLDMKKKGAFRSAVAIGARSIKDISGTYALIVDRESRSQLVALPS